MLIPPNSPEAKAGQISPFPNVFLVLGSLVLEDFLKVTSSHPCLQASRLTNQCSSQMKAPWWFAKGSSKGHPGPPSYLTLPRCSF